MRSTQRVIDATALGVLCSLAMPLVAAVHTPDLQAAPHIFPGDLNCDGGVDFNDIDPFVALLSGD